MDHAKERRPQLSVATEKLANGYERTIVTNSNPASTRRKLILHFDNRNTLEVSRRRVDRRRSQAARVL